jgi:hypothetical protein
MRAPDKKSARTVILLQATGSTVVFRTVRIATLEFTRATPGNLVSASLCSRSKSAMSAMTTRNK